MRIPIVFLLVALTLVGCQTMQPKFTLQSKETVTIENFKFEKSLATDSNGSRWKMVGIRPTKLPYAGKIAALSAEDRWLKLFEAALASIKADCGGAPTQMPEIKAAELDYNKLGNSPEHPAYIQAKYMCQ